MVPKIVLSNGNEIPQMFQGTVPFHMIKGYKFKHWRVVTSTEKAVECGMGIDTAVAYGNHKEVAMGIKLSAVEKKNIFITSKLYNTQQDCNIKQHYKNICNELLVDKLNLLLLHWPQTSTYVDAWKLMEELYYEGFVDNIGIANVEIRHLEQLKKEGCINPHVIQIERHPYNQQNDIVEFAKEEGICVQSYSPLARMNSVIENKTFEDLANKYSVSIPQLLLKWQIQDGIIPVVRSVRKKKIQENINSLDITIKREDMEIINGIGIKYRINNPMRFSRYY